MTKIDSPSAAIGHLYAFRDDKAALQQEVHRLQRAGELALDQAQLDEVCAFWKIPGVSAYGALTGAAATTTVTEPGGASSAQRKSSKFGKSVGWSDFALGRNQPGTGHSYFQGSPAELVKLIEKHWDERTPGTGRADLNKVVLVSVPAEGFVCGTVKVKPHTKLEAELHRRQPHEDPYVRVAAHGAPEPAEHAKIVLYSKEALLENDGKRTGDSDWEIVSIIASPVENEPMDPLTMARNMLEKPGGTPVDYSAEEFARAVYYWSQRAKAAATE